MKILIPNNWNNSISYFTGTYLVFFSTRVWWSDIRGVEATSAPWLFLTAPDGLEWLVINNSCTVIAGTGANRVFVTGTTASTILMARLAGTHCIWILQWWTLLNTERSILAVLTRITLIGILTNSYKNAYVRTHTHIYIHIYACKSVCMYRCAIAIKHLKDYNKDYLAGIKWICKWYTIKNLAVISKLAVFCIQLPSIILSLQIAWICCGFH